MCAADNYDVHVSPSRPINGNLARGRFDRDFCRREPDILFFPDCPARARFVVYSRSATARRAVAYERPQREGPGDGVGRGRQGQRSLRSRHGEGQDRGGAYPSLPSIPARASPSVAHIRLLTGVPTTPPRDVTSVPPSSLPAPHQATAKAYVAEKREELRPKLRAAMEKAEPSLREFMRSPQAKYLRENPKAVAAVCMLLAGVGIPGAASMLTLVNMMGPMEALFPLVLMMAQPLAEMGVDAA